MVYEFGASRDVQPALSGWVPVGLFRLSCRFVANRTALAGDDLLALAVFSRCRKVAHNDFLPNALSRFFSIFSSTRSSPYAPWFSPVF